MINIIIRKLREQYKSVLIYAGSLIGYALIMVSIFPMIKKMDLEALMKGYPPELAKFFGTSGIATYNTIEGYISMEFLAFFFVLILTFYIGSAAGSVIAGQIEKRTMDFNLSQPISRTKIVFAETAVGLKFSALIVILMSTSMLFFGKIFNSEFKVGGLIAFTLTAVFFMWVLYGIAIFLSSMLKSKISVMLGTVGITMTFYIFSSLTRIVDKLKDYDKFSIFYLYDPEKLLKTGVIHWPHILILLGILLAGLISSIIIFNRKDV